MGNDIQRRLIVFGVVLVVALLFLWPTASVSVKKLSGMDVTSEEILGENWFSRPISLGLDLSGGVHLVYRVVTDEAIKGRLQAELNAMRSDLRRAKVAVTRAHVTDDFTAEFTLLSDKSLKEAKTIVSSSGSGLLLKEEKESGNRPVLVYHFNQAAIEDIRSSAVARARDTLENRVNQFGVAEPLITRSGTDRIILQMPGVKDIEAVKSVVGRVAKLEFRLLPQPGASSGSTITLKDHADGSPMKVSSDVLMDGSAVQNARVDFDPTGRVEVSLTFTSEGGRQFARATGENVGRNMAIILDNEVYSAPTIRERIAGGSCSITGDFSMEEAKELAIILKAGALPAPLEILQERTVGPSLGQESIRKGVMAIAIGFVAVLVFMVVYYKKAGVIACGVLIVNIILVLAALSAFGATLTLPGIAGLALTVGMAVDANVIIYERIREELHLGAGRDVAVSSGFEKAFSAIIDSNVTTLLAGVILYYFGTGPVRGFAVTLCVGIITTLYCCTFASRIAFDSMELKGGNRGLSI